MSETKGNSTTKRPYCYRLLGMLVLVATLVTAWLLMRAHVTPKHPNGIILISIDTCRADYLSCYGYLRQTTPNIDQLAAQSVIFKNAISPVPTTRPAHCSMLAGTIPPYHGVHGNLDDRLRDSTVTLAEILKENGFKTAAFVSAFVMDSQFGLSQGFDIYNDSFVQKERLGEQTNRFVLEWLEQHKNGRFFLFLHYFDPHAPYAPPEPFAFKFAGDPYAGEIAYVDHCIGLIILKLKDLGLFDSSLIIVTSDHGEMLGEHGEQYHSYFIYQSAIKVPLIFKFPGQSESREITDLVGLIDIVPTVCGLLDIEPPAVVQGMDLGPYFFDKAGAVGQRQIYCGSLQPTNYGCNSLLGVVTDRFKYIQTTRPELYDIVADPQESNNLIGLHPRRADILRNTLKQMLEQSIPSSVSDTKVALDQQSRDRLESLGYVSAGISRDFDFDQSKDDPKDMISLHSSVVEIHNLIYDKKLDEAKKLCEQVYLQYPDSHITYRCLAKLAYKEGDRQKTIEYIYQSLKLNPDQAGLHFNLAMLLAEQGKYDDAAHYLVEVLRINPNQILAYNNLALLLERQGKAQEAIRHLTESLRIKHNQPDIHIKLGDMVYRTGKFDEAAKHWAEALRFNPEEPHAVHDRLGSVFYQMDMLDDAIEHWRMSLKFKPDQPEIENNIAAALAQKRKKHLDETPN